MDEQGADSPPLSGFPAQESLEINKVNTSMNNPGKRAHPNEDNQQLPPAKKRKKCDAHEGALPFRSEMIQLDDVRKLDQRLIVEGHLHCVPSLPPSSSSSTSSSSTREVHLDLISDDPETGMTHRLPILLQGNWATDLLKDISLTHSTNKRVRLAFKEGKLVKDARSGPENNLLVFSRGCEMWVCKSNEGKKGEGDKETWKRFRTFAAAQNGVKEERTTPDLERRSVSVVPHQQGAATHSLDQAFSAASSSSTTTSVHNNAHQASGASGETPRTQSLQVRRHESPSDLSSIISQALPDTHSSPTTSAQCSNTKTTAPLNNISQSQLPRLPHLTRQDHPPAPEASLTRTNDMPMVSTRLPPHQYQTISDIRKFTTSSVCISVIGLAITSNDLKTTNQGHHSSSFKIVDPSCFPNQGGTQGYAVGEGMTVTIMHKEKEHVPLNVESGDIVLIRNIKTQCWKSKVKITGFHESNYVWAIAKTSSSASSSDAQGSNGSMSLSPGFRADMISPQEYAFARELHLWNVQRLQQQPSSNDASTSSSSSHSIPGNFTIQNGSNNHAGTSNVQYIQPIRKASAYRRLNDLEPLINQPAHSALFDCVVEIVSPTETYGNWLKIYISDYSTHSALRPHPELVYLNHDSSSSEGSLLVIEVFQDDFRHRLDDIARDLGEVGNIVEIRGIRLKPYGAFWNGHVGGKRPEFGWRIIKENEEDPRKTQLLQAKKAFFGTEEKDLGARFAEEAEAEKDNSFTDSGYDSVSAEDGNEIPVTKGSSAGPSTIEKTGQPGPPKRLQKLSKSRKTLKLSELKIPRDPPNASCFFDCYCEVVEDVYDSFSSPVRLYVTDHTVNDVLFENSQHSAYPQKRIIFEIAFWECPDKVNKIKHLKEGGRVFIENIRMKKSRSYNLVEGNVGNKGDFRVTVLDREDPEWAVLQKARELQESTMTAEREIEQVAKPREEEVQYVRCQRQADPIVGYNQMMRNQQDAQYRLRGRVIAIDRPLEEILVNHCDECQQYMKYGSTICEKCPPGAAYGFSPKRWRVGLSIELEQPGRDISRDAVNNDMAVWVHVDEKIPGVDEKVPGLVFMNGLQPSKANLPIAQALLKKIVDNPSENNHTNPIFDFCVLSFPRAGVLLMTKTALIREGQSLPWSTAQV